jgi:hypothetical protein
MPRRPKKDIIRSAASERQAIAHHDTVERLVKDIIVEYARPDVPSWKNAQTILCRQMVPRWKTLAIDTIDSCDVAKLLADRAHQCATGLGAVAEVGKRSSALFCWAAHRGQASDNPCAAPNAPMKLKLS